MILLLFIWRLIVVIHSYIYNLMNIENINYNRLAPPITDTVLSSDTHNFNTDSSSSFLFKTATLNCRSLRKMGNHLTSSNFIRHLRSYDLSILALQETHANSPQLEDLFHTQFQAVQSVWSSHCGLVCFSPDLSLQHVQTSPCGRLITATVVHHASLFAPVFVSVLYAPANVRERYPCLTNLVPSRNNSSSLPISPSRHILLGDFNYSYGTSFSAHNRCRQAPTLWLDYISNFLLMGLLLLAVLLKLPLVVACLNLALIIYSSLLISVSQL